MPPMWGSDPSTTTSPASPSCSQPRSPTCSKSWAKLLDQLSVDVEDAALSFAQSLRLTLRLCRSRPEISAVLIRHGMDYMESPQGLAPRALRDIRAGIASGRFQPAEPRLARAAVAGALLATLQLALTDPDLVNDAACDQLAEQLLRMLGMPFEEAHALAHALCRSPSSASPADAGTAPP